MVRQLWNSAATRLEILLKIWLPSFFDRSKSLFLDLYVTLVCKHDMVHKTGWILKEIINFICVIPKTFWFFFKLPVMNASTSTSGLAKRPRVVRLRKTDIQVREHVLFSVVWSFISLWANDKAFLLLHNINTASNVKTINGDLQLNCWYFWHYLSLKWNTIYKTLHVTMNMLHNSCKYLQNNLHDCKIKYQNTRKRMLNKYT